MVFVCECGKKFRAPDGTPPSGHACPNCAGTLRLLGSPPPAVDINVLIEQKKALRDEMRVRDRALRIAQAEIQRLKAENEKLRSELDRAHGGVPYVSIAEAPVLVDRSADWGPMELPSGRLDLSALPVLEEIPTLADAPQLPSDRLPLYSPAPE